MLRLIVFGFVLVSVATTFSGCALFVPVVESVQKLGVTRGDREQLLPKRVDGFQRAIYWGRKSDALAFSVPESSQVIKHHLRSVGSQQKVVESNIDLVDFEEDSYKALVEVLVKYYEVPYYTVQQKRELQTWKFSTAHGWLIESVERIS